MDKPIFFMMVGLQKFMPPLIVDVRSVINGVMTQTNVFFDTSVKHIKNFGICHL